MGFINESLPCPWCGAEDAHVGTCPKVKRIEYNDDGSIKSVEFFAPNDYYLSMSPTYGTWTNKLTVENDDGNGHGFYKNSPYLNWIRECISSTAVPPPGPEYEVERGLSSSPPPPPVKLIPGTL